MPDLRAHTALEALFRHSRRQRRQPDDAARRGRRLSRARTARARRPRRACWRACSNPRAASSSTTARDIRDDLLAFRRRLGYVPEEPYLYPFLSGREYLQLVGRLRELPERAARPTRSTASCSCSISAPRPIRASARIRKACGRRSSFRRRCCTTRRRDLRRTRNRARRRDDDDAAPPGADAGLARQGDSLQLAHPRSRREASATASSSCTRARSSRTTRSRGCARCCRARRSKACSRSW